MSGGPPRFEPDDPGFVADPYPTYAALRDVDPVHRASDGAWVLSRYADVAAALGDDRLGNAPAPHAVLRPRNRERHVAADVANRILPFQDPPEHTPRRRAVARAFARQLKERPPDIEGIARELVDAALARGRFDVLRDYATPLSVRVICDLLGVPREDAPRLGDWTQWFFRLFAPIPSTEVLAGLDAALTDFRAYFADQLAQRRRAPGADLLSVLAVRPPDVDGLDDQEIVDTCMLLFADGVENVDSGIASGVLALLRHPEQLERLRTGQVPWLQGADECLRYESPAQQIARVARAEIELHGVRIPEGRPVLLLLGSANRDPEVFDDPDAFDVARDPNPYLSFGKGRHSCVGAHLVRGEMEVALRVLFEEAPGLALRGGVPRWRVRPAHRWLESLEARV